MELLKKTEAAAILPASFVMLGTYHSFSISYSPVILNGFSNISQ